jgi:predicted lipid-binding transport protein (Tim44 family)
MNIVFLMILAVAVIVKLYSTFGRSVEKNGNVVVKPLSGEMNKKTEAQVYLISGDETEDKTAEPTTSESDKNVPDFDKEAFLHGARRVFEMVLQAFNSGDIMPVCGLVSKKVFNAFKEALAFRQENKMAAEVDFICFDKTEIKSVKRLKNTVRVVVEFVSEQINLLRNAEGEVVEGDENFIQKITDVWTFERSLNAKNYEWVLVSTKKDA